MKKAIFFIFLALLAPMHASAFDGDVDDNGYIDTAFGGTNTSSGCGDLHKTVAIPVYNPSVGSSALWRAPRPLTITNVHYYSADAWSGQIQRGDASAANNVNMQSSDSTVLAGTNVDVSVFAFATVDRFDYLSLATSTGTPTLVAVQFEYEYTAGSVFYVDSDGDGYGDPNSTTVEAFSPPSGYSADNTDCDDTEAGINPGAKEIPEDTIDQDCDGSDAILSSLGGSFACAASGDLSAGTTLLSYNDPLSAGTLKHVKFSCPAVGTTGRVYVFREVGANFAIIGSEVISSISSGDNGYTLTTPITVEDGDFLGLYSATSKIHRCNETGSEAIRYIVGEVTTATATSSWTILGANYYLKAEAYSW